MGDSGRRLAVARFGEAVAARFLLDRGVRLVGRNVRVGRGEIDLHVLIDGTSTAVEVKTRIGGASPHAALAQFSEGKAATVRRYARLLTPPAWRVDLIAVTLRAPSVDVHWVPFAG